MSLRSYGCPGRGSRVYSTVKVDGQELVSVIPVSVEVSRDLKISIVTKGKEKKQGGKVIKKTREENIHRKSTIHSYCTTSVGWEANQAVLSDGLGNYFSARINESLIFGVM